MLCMTTKVIVGLKLIKGFNQNKKTVGSQSHAPKPFINTSDCFTSLVSISHITYYQYIIIEDYMLIQHYIIFMLVKIMIITGNSPHCT
jgi:hypothetical protein